jgi:hypothetical protein
VFLYNNIF